MNQEELIKLVDELCTMPRETEWVEFKENYYDPQEIGEYISALSNSIDNLARNTPVIILLLLNINLMYKNFYFM